MCSTDSHYERSLTKLTSSLSNVSLVPARKWVLGRNKKTNNKKKKPADCSRSLIRAKVHSKTRVSEHRNINVHQHYKSFLWHFVTTTRLESNFALERERERGKITKQKKGVCYSGGP